MPDIHQTYRAARSVVDARPEQRMATGWIFDERCEIERVHTRAHRERIAAEAASGRGDGYGRGLRAHQATAVDAAAALGAEVPTP